MQPDLVTSHISTLSHLVKVGRWATATGQMYRLATRRCLWRYRSDSVSAPDSPAVDSTEGPPERAGVVWWRGVNQAPEQGAAMADKSPRQHMSKKAGKSLKEKRADKRAKLDAKNQSPTVPPRGKS